MTGDRGVSKRINLGKDRLLPYVTCLPNKNLLRENGQDKSLKLLRTLASFVIETSLNNNEKSHKGD